MKRHETIAIGLFGIWLLLCWFFSKRFRSQLDEDRWPEIDHSPVRTPSEWRV